MCRQIRHPLSYYRVMAESEKNSSVRLERILLAALDKEVYPTQLLKNNIESMPDFDFTYPDKVEKRNLSVAMKDGGDSQVSVMVSHFHGRVYSVEVPNEERKIWITKAAVSLAEDNREYECLPLTDWKVALPVQEANFKSKKINLVIRPVDIFLNQDENSRRMFMILDVIS